MSEQPTYYIDTGDGVTGVRMDGTSVRRVRTAPEPLLTRSEAANDPEVRKMVIGNMTPPDNDPEWGLMWVWRDLTNKAISRVAEVTDDE